MRRIHRSSLSRFSLALGLAAAMAVTASVARADAWNKRTVVSFGQSVEVPGAVLGPGKYVMKLVDLTAQHRVVQFSNERESHVFTTAMAIPAYRTRVTSETALTFYEAPAGQPQALRTWYYPGDSDGQEFVYPHGRIAQIAAVPRDTNTFGTRSEAAPAPAPVEDLSPAPAQSESIAPVETPVETSEAVLPEEPVLLAQNNPPAQPEIPPAPAELPKTSSYWPAIAMLGLISIGAAIAARTLRRSY